MTTTTTKLQFRYTPPYTILTNLNDISQQLNKQPEIIQKFFCLRLNVYGFKKNQEYYFSGNHNNFDSLLCDFIETYQRCACCKNLQTCFILESNKRFFIDCYACGKQSFIPNDLFAYFLIQYHKRK